MPSSSRLGTETCREKSPEAISAEPLVHLLHGAGERPRDAVAEEEGQADAAHREGDHHPARGQVRLVAGVDAGHHVRLGLVHQLVGQPFQAIGERSGLGELDLASLRGLPAADPLDHAGDHGDELLVVLAHPAHQLHLVLGHELEAVEVVAELVELAQGGLQGALVGHQERGGYAVELARGVVLELAVGGDLPLELDQILGAPVDVGERPEAHRPHRDEEDGDGQEGGQELGMDAHGQPGHQADEPVPHRVEASASSERRSRSISSGSKRTPRYWTRRIPRWSMIEVRNVWSTSPRSPFL